MLAFSKQKCKITGTSIVTKRPFPYAVSFTWEGYFDNAAVLESVINFRRGIRDFAVSLFPIMKDNRYLECIRPSTSMTDNDHSRTTEEKWVWIADPDECFVAGYVLQETNESVTVKLDTGEVSLGKQLIIGTDFEAQ